MSFYVIGLSHRSTPVEIREKFAQMCISGLPGADGVTLEAVSVLTCNRVEVYFYGPVETAEKLFGDWASQSGFSIADIQPYLYRHRDEGGIRHLFRVVSGLDSMVLGENQILHQVKSSYQAAIEAKCVGKKLHALFQKALKLGKSVRSETCISENTVSMASAAVELANSIFGPLEECGILVIGAGEMASLVARHMKDRGARELVFTNRTLSRAEELADTFGGKAVPFDKLPELLAAADVIISSTGAPRPILQKTLIEKAISAREYRPMFLIDIAVPRDVEPDAGEIENVYLYNVDDLQGVVDEHVNLRRVEAEKVEKIIAVAVDGFQATLQSFSVVPVIRSLREQTDNLRRNEVERFLRRHPELPPELAKDFEEFSRQLVAKWLHAPTKALKDRTNADQTEIQEIAKIFGLSEQTLSETPLVTVFSREDKK